MCCFEPMIFSRRSILKAIGTTTTIGSLPSDAQTNDAHARTLRFGLDLFSLRSQGWTPFQLLDWCAQRKLKLVHFSEIRFLGGLEPENLKRIRAHAEQLGIE